MDMVNKKENKPIGAEEPSIYLKMAGIRKFNQVILGTSLCLFISLVIMTSISYPTLIFWPDILFSIVFWVILGLLFAYSFTDGPTKLIKPGVTLVGNILFIIIINFLALYTYFNYAKALPIAYMISLILFTALLIGAVLTASINIYNFYYRFKNRRKNSKLYKSGKIKKVLIISLLILVIPFIIMAIPGILRIPITITPKDYQVKFVFWGGYGQIDPTIGQELNEHNATVVFCNFGNVSGLTFITTITNYNNSYPNMSIFLSVPGTPGGSVWDGNTQNVIDYAKTIVSVVQNNNLTTVKGLAFDIEAPSVHLVQGIDASPNKARHDESIALWLDFFNWMDLNAPELELSAINYVESGIDVFDRDYDLHYIRRYSFLDLDTQALDEYAPMSYRGWYMGTKPYGDTMENNPIVNYLDGGPYWVYTQMYLLAEALDMKFGNHDKIGVYLGITNLACYSNQSAHGYNNLVRDALIAKHFGVKRISIFLLTTVMENGYYMGGVFDSYGDNFLDRFNNSINGADSNKPFQIWYKPKFNIFLTFGHVDQFVFDAYSNLDSFLGIIYVSVIFVGNCLVAYYGWKKIKSKALETYNANKKVI